MSDGSFSCPLKLDQVRDGMRIDLSADAADCSAIAGRLGLASLDRLEAHVVLTRDGERIHAEGRVQAGLAQPCVVTGEPVAAYIDEPFAIDFLPEPSGSRGDEEVELGAAECDTMFHDGAVIDLGGAVVDTLALSLDPYPRSAGAEAALKEAGVMSEEDASPFAALAALRDKLDQSN